MKTFFRFIFRLLLILVILTVLGFVFLLSWMMITDYQPESVEPLEWTGYASPATTTDLADRLSAGEEVTLMTWNLGYGGLGREMNFFFDNGRMVRPHQQLSRKYMDEILVSLQQADSIDFYLLQEVDERSKRSYYFNQREQVLMGLPGFSMAYAVNYDVKFVPIPAHSPYGKVKAGMATLSTLYPSLAERHAFEGNYAWPKNLFMLDRCFIRTDFDLENGKKLVIINTHNSAYDDGTLKYKQLEVLREIMLGEYSKGHYVIVGGDWNLTPPGYNKFWIRNGDWGRDNKPGIDEGYLPDDWKWVFDKKVPTNRDLRRSYIRGRNGVSIIDFFAVSPNIEVTAVKTSDLRFENSDHHPVVMKVRLRINDDATTHPE